MSDLLDILFSGPTLPGTIALGVCLAYWLMLIVGAVDLNLFDFDLNVDVDAQPDSLGTGWGMPACKWLNSNDVPSMIWTSIFAASYVVVSAALVNSRGPDDDWGAIAATAAASAAIALVATKLLTQPLRGKFETVEPNVAE